MHNKDIAIADTSVLIAFEKINLLSLLCATYDDLYLTRAVYNEFSNQLQDCFSIKEAPASLTSFLIYEMRLGLGESETIALSHYMGIRALIDDLKARKVALSLGCQISGSIGVLYRMEKEGVISSAYNKIVLLKNMGFHISDKLLDKPSS